MDMIIPPLTSKIMFESNSLKSRILVRRLAVPDFGLSDWLVCVELVGFVPGGVPHLKMSWAALGLFRR